MESIDLDQLLDGRNIKQVGALFLQMAANQMEVPAFNPMLESVLKIHDTAKPPVFKLNDKEVDLRKSVPLLVKDWKELKKLGVDVMKVSGGEIEMDLLIIMTQYVCKKANPELTDEDFESMPGAWFMRIGQVVQEIGGDIDVPF